MPRTLMSYLLSLGRCESIKTRLALHLAEQATAIE